VVGDDFVAGLAPGVWDVVDPAGLLGIQQQPSGIALTLPAGTVHDAFNQGIFVPRVRQEILDADFDVSTRFSTLPGLFNFQGIGIEGADGSLLRVEVINDGAQQQLLILWTNGSTFQVLALQPVPVSAPFDLRVERSGSQFTVSTAPDGAAWTPRASFSFAMEPAAVGVYLGNLLGTAHTVGLESFDVRPTN
jgi:regulation of enolase protein 1 (concanavalin A-like superfamily)